MVIKPISVNIQMLGFVSAVMIPCDIMIWRAFDNKIFAIVFVLVSSIYLIREWISLGRTIHITNQGLKISFLFFTKEYSWSQLKTKRIADYSKAFGSGDNSGRGIDFSVHERNCKGIKPIDYSVWFHPFTYVFVAFEQEKKDNNRYRYFYTYTYIANEKALLDIVGEALDPP